MISLVNFSILTVNLTSIQAYNIFQRAQEEPPLEKQLIFTVLVFKSIDSM